MRLSSLPFIAAATAMAEETAVSAYAGWRAFLFLKKLASDDWRWTELAQMIALYLERSPDARADVKRMAAVALGGVLVFLAAHAGITYCVWRRKSSAIRARLVVQAGCITALNGNNAVLNGRLAAQTGRIAALTGSLDEAEETISILLEQGWQGQEVSPVVASRSRRDEEAANSGAGRGEWAEKNSGLSTGGVESVLKKNTASPHAASISSGHGHRHGDKRCKGDKIVGGMFYWCSRCLVWTTLHSLWLCVQCRLCTYVSRHARFSANTRVRWYSSGPRLR